LSSKALFNKGVYAFARAIKESRQRRKVLSVLENHGVTSNDNVKGLRSAVFVASPKGRWWRRHAILISLEIVEQRWLESERRRYITAGVDITDGSTKNFPKDNRYEIIFAATLPPFGKFMHYLYGIGGKDHDLFRIICSYV
jgi:hypothetical protein